MASFIFFEGERTFSWSRGGSRALTVFVLACLLTLAPAVTAAEPEVELGAGLVAADSLAPAVWGRAGLSVGWATFSLRGLAVLGGDGGYVSDAGPASSAAAFRAWLASAEARATVSWFYLGVGAGLGRLMRSNCSCTEIEPASGRSGLSGQLFMGGRFRAGPLFLAPELSVLAWTRVDQSAGQWNPAMHDATLLGFMLGLGVVIPLGGLGTSDPK